MQKTRISVNGEERIENASFLCGKTSPLSPTRPSTAWSTTATVYTKLIMSVCVEKDIPRHQWKDCNPYPVSERSDQEAANRCSPCDPAAFSSNIGSYVCVEYHIVRRAESEMAHATLVRGTRSTVSTAVETLVNKRVRS
jgi:hypothetical protein